MSDAELIDAIERIRTTNNRHWMDLVRLAFREAPDEARALMQQIQACDGEVRRLTQELANGQASKTERASCPLCAAGIRHVG